MVVLVLVLVLVRYDEPDTQTSKAHRYAALLTNPRHYLKKIQIQPNVLRIFAEKQLNKSKILLNLLLLSDSNYSPINQ